MKKVLLIFFLMAGSLLYAQEKIETVAKPMDRAAGDSVKDRKSVV